MKPNDVPLAPHLSSRLAGLRRTIDLGIVTVSNKGRAEGVDVFCALAYEGLSTLWACNSQRACRLFELPK